MTSWSDFFVLVESDFYDFFSLRFLDFVLLDVFDEIGDFCDGFAGFVDLADDVLSYRDVMGWVL